MAREGIRSCCGQRIKLGHAGDCQEYQADAAVFRRSRAKELCEIVVAKGWASKTERDGTLRTIVDTALASDVVNTDAMTSATSAEDIRDIILEAEKEHAANVVHDAGLAKGV